MTIDEFRAVDLRVATILEASRVEGSDKLVALKITVGETERELLAGIGKAYEPGELIGKQIVVVYNLDPRIMMGRESQGMLLAASGPDGKPVLLVPEKEVEPGTRIN